MKTATNLSAELTETPFTAPAGQRVTIHFEVTPGSFLNVALGAEGLVIHHAGIGIGIPLKDLAELAGRLEPKLAEIIVPAPVEAPAEK